MSAKLHPQPSPQDEADALNMNLGRRVKDLRSQVGWSLEQLASSSGVSRSMLSEIERERANPTLSVAFRIARAFGCSLHDLIGTVESAPEIRVVKAGDGSQIYRSDVHCQIRTLSPINLEKDVEFYELELRPKGVLKSHPHFEGAREFLTVVEGEVMVLSDRSEARLSRGDSATYRADVPHTITNLSNTDALMFLVVIYR